MLFSSDSNTGATVLLAILISWFLYHFMTAAPQPDERRRQTASHAANVGTRRQPSRQVQPQAPAATRLPPMSSEIKSMLQGQATLPNHVDRETLSKSGAGIGGTSVLIDGLVAFRHGLGIKGDVADLRKDRARVLSSLLSLDSSLAPPTKGGTMVISVPKAELECQKLHRILYLLATYYNLIVVVVVPSGETDTSIGSKLEQAVAAIGDTSPLPSHRILQATHATGVIAMVRQLQRVALVVVGSMPGVASEVQSQLSRFGFRVVVVPPSSNGGSSISSCLATASQ